MSLVVCSSAACGGGSSDALVDSVAVVESMPPALATTTTAVVAKCVRSTTTGEPSELTLTVGAIAACTSEGDTLVTIRNSTSTKCTSDVIATLSNGDRLLFSSESGYGGERGRWAPLAADVVEGVGIVEYPPGDRSWPITLPPLGEGPQTMTLPIVCAAKAITLTATFTVSSGPRLWVQPLFPSDESLAAPVEGLLDYDKANDCFTLERNGERFPVVWPAGTSATTSGPTVVSRDGLQIHIGQHVSGGGGYLSVAEQVGIPAACLPPSGEVAVFNTHETITATS